MARACKVARPRNLCYCEFELLHSGASRFRPAIFRRTAHMALEEFATVTSVGRPLAAALVPLDRSVPIALRGKSSRRSRWYPYCARRTSISAGIPSASDFVRVSKRSRMSTTFCWVPMDGARISTLDKSTGAASITFVPFATVSRVCLFDLAYCSSDHRGVLVAALHEEPLGNVENLLDRLLRVLIACHGHLRPCYRDKHTMSGVRVEKGWRQKSPTAVTASLETRPTMDGEPER